jgi:LDH2 family malate/lactate/ureidoglycolate dehydrogenase
VSKTTHRLRLDDLRRFAVALASEVGLRPDRAATLATQLLWYDAAGASEFGIASLPSWLARIENGEIDARSEGHVVSERAGAAVFNAQRGLPLLILERATALASEKARDVGIAIVHVIGLGPACPSAAIVAELAIGPHVGIILGPAGSVAVALPTAQGLPIVFDATLVRGKGTKKVPRAIADLTAPWNLLVPNGDWLVLATTIAALEPLATFHERIETAIQHGKDEPGLLLPGPWEARRRSARELGVDLAPDIRESFLPWIERAHISAPWTDSEPSTA